jgi:predicted GNAT family N-acyltransferase
MDYSLEVRPDGATLADAHAVRTRVFVEEQGIPEAQELDGRDGDAIHAIARADGRAVGTGRLRLVGEETAKMERVSVLPAYRSEGGGRRLVAMLEREARDRGVDRVRLHARTDAEGFYHELGYETKSELFQEVGHPHVEMARALDAGRP